MAYDNHQSDEGFKAFAISLEKAINRFKKLTGNEELDFQSREFLKLQKYQVETLVALEIKFKKALMKDSRGQSVFRAFISYILDIQKNLLNARIFFRERQGTFTKFIANALRTRNVKQLCKFHFNYKFILFALKAKPWGKNSKIVKLANAITEIRTDLITINLPMAISRARIFSSRTPKSHLSYSDFIGICSSGLMAAVDKYCLPFSKSFRSVMIGRMTGDMIENFSETSIHIYPSLKRCLYRANKVVHHQPVSVDYKELAKTVNKGLDKSHRIAPDELANLMMAANGLISADTPIEEQAQDGTNHIVTVVDRFQAPEETRPDIIIEQKDLINGLECAMNKELSLREKKLLKMKGINSP